MFKTLHYARQLLKGHILKNSSNRGFQTSSIKNSAHEPLWVYRRGPYRAPVHIERLADGVGILMWYWILYHCFTQFEHLSGEFDYPEPEKWTNEELGIPPDDEDY